MKLNFIILLAVMTMLPCGCLEVEAQAADVARGMTVPSIHALIPRDSGKDSLYWESCRQRIQKKVDDRFWEIPVRMKGARSEEEPAPRTLVVNTTGFGELERMLEENDGKWVDSLVVCGPMDKSDFRAIWECALNDKLRVLNLEKAVMENDEVPDMALYDPLQFESDRWLGIRRIILPEGITRIGDTAFPLMRLQEINIPSTVTYLGSTLFAYDVELDCELVVPEGVEGINFQTFLNCRSLRRCPILPGSLRYIQSHAFYKAALPTVELPEGLEYIATGAFAGSELERIDIPDSCVYLDGYVFQSCLHLREVRLPSALEEVPEAFLNCCFALLSIEIPSGCKKIGFQAFDDCDKLETATFPEGLEEIEAEAFLGTNLHTIDLPSSVTSLGKWSCNTNGLKELYCRAVVPPACSDKEGPVSPSKRPWVKLYVPTESVEEYKAARVWSGFSETIGIDTDTALKLEREERIYADSPCFDLMGRQLSEPLSGTVYIRAGKKYVGR